MNDRIKRKENIIKQSEINLFVYENFLRDGKEFFNYRPQLCFRQIKSPIRGRFRCKLLFDNIILFKS